MATHSCILAWIFPWTEEPGRLHTVHGVHELDMTEKLTLSSNMYFTNIFFQSIDCLLIFLAVSFAEKCLFH